MKVKVNSLSCVQLFVTLWMVAYQAPPLMGFSRQELLEWVAISFSRGSSWPRDWIQVSHIAGRCFILWATREARCTNESGQKPWRPFYFLFLFTRDPSLLNLADKIMYPPVAVSQPLSLVTPGIAQGAHELSSHVGRHRGHGCTQSLSSDLGWLSFWNCWMPKLPSKDQHFIPWYGTIFPKYLPAML